MELERRGMRTVTVVTDAFLPLAVAQTRARGGELRMVVVTHPVGGLRRDELETRVAQVVGELKRGHAA
jgi:hypothetical protein